MTTLVIILVACQPTIPVESEQLVFRKVCSAKDGDFEKKEYKLSTDPSIYKHTSLIRHGEGTIVPPWWFAVMSFSSGFTYAAKEGLPCKDDLVGIRFTFMAANLSTELLLEIREFLNQCYLPTYSFAKYGSKRIPGDQWNKPEYEQFLRIFGSEELAWFGSLIYASVGGPYFYKGRFTEHAIQPWNRKVSCHTWLLGGTTGESGLYKRVYDERGHCISQLDQVLRRDKSFFETEKRRLKNFGFQSTLQIAEHNCIRNIFTENSNSGNNKLFHSLNDIAVHRDQDKWTTVKGFISNATSKLGTALQKLYDEPVTEIIQKAMPPGVTLLLMGIYIVIPFGMIFSNYSINFLIVCSVGIFALKFTSYLFYLASWITSNLFSIMSLSFKNDSSYSQDIYQFVVNGLFLAFPLVFISVMAWAGIQIGFGLQNAYEKIAGRESSVAKAAETGSSILQEAATRVVIGQALPAVKSGLSNTKVAKKIKSKIRKGTSTVPRKK